MAAAAQVPVVASADLSASGTSDLFQNSSADNATGNAFAGSLTGKVAVLPKQRRNQQNPTPNVRVEILLPAFAPNPRPTEVMFGGLQDPTLQVRRAIPLDVAVEESTVIVTWPEVDEFGTGETLSSALDDFSHTVRELYHHLYANDVKPGADLLRVKEILGEYIEPRTR